MPDPTTSIEEIYFGGLLPEVIVRPKEFKGNWNDPILDDSSLYNQRKRNEEVKNFARQLFTEQRGSIEDRMQEMRDDPLNPLAYTPDADFSSIGYHLNKGNYEDAALYAAFAALPGAAGPIVNRVKPYINSIGQTVKNIVSEIPNPFKFTEESFERYVRPDRNPIARYIDDLRYFPQLQKIQKERKAAWDKMPSARKELDDFQKEFKKELKKEFKKKRVLTEWIYDVNRKLEKRSPKDYPLDSSSKSLGTQFAGWLNSKGLLTDDIIQNPSLALNNDKLVDQFIEQYSSSVRGVVLPKDAPLEEIQDALLSTKGGGQHGTGHYQSNSEGILDRFSTPRNNYEVGYQGDIKLNIPGLKDAKTSKEKIDLIKKYVEDFTDDAVKHERFLRDNPFELDKIQVHPYGSVGSRERFIPRKLLKEYSNLLELKNFTTVSKEANPNIDQLKGAFGLKNARSSDNLFSPIDRKTINKLKEADPELKSIAKKFRDSKTSKQLESLKNMLEFRVNLIAKNFPFSEQEKLLKSNISEIERELALAQVFSEAEKKKILDSAVQIGPQDLSSPFRYGSTDKRLKDYTEALYRSEKAALLTGIPLTAFAGVIGIGAMLPTYSDKVREKLDLSEEEWNKLSEEEKRTLDYLDQIESAKKRGIDVSNENYLERTRKGLDRHSYQYGGEIPKYQTGTKVLQPWEYIDKQGKLNTDVSKLPDDPKGPERYKEQLDFMRNWIPKRGTQMQNALQSYMDREDEQYPIDAFLHKYINIPLFGAPYSYGLSKEWGTTNKELGENVLKNALNNINTVKFKDSSKINPKSYVPSAYGTYSPRSHSINFASYPSDATKIHEIGHGTRLGSYKVFTDLIRNIIKKDELYRTKKDSYYHSPEEIYSRIWEIRKGLDLNPTETITKETLQKKLEEKRSDYKINDYLDLFNYLQPETVIELLNGLVYEDTSLDMDKAQYGGNIEKAQNGERVFQIPEYLMQQHKNELKFVESADGVLMKNPESTATGFYGQLFSEIENLPEMKGITRDMFAADTALQNKIYDLRFKEGIPDSNNIRNSTVDNLNDLYTKYGPQIKEKGYNPLDLAGIVNLLGRQGTREFLGYHVRDKRPLAEVFPSKYGKNKTQANHTPDEYVEKMRSVRPDNLKDYNYDSDSFSFSRYTKPYKEGQSLYLNLRNKFQNGGEVKEDYNIEKGKENEEKILSEQPIQQELPYQEIISYPIERTPFQDPRVPKSADKSYYKNLYNTDVPKTLAKQYELWANTYKSPIGLKIDSYKDIYDTQAFFKSGRWRKGFKNIEEFRKPSHPMLGTINPETNTFIPDPKNINSNEEIARYILKENIPVKFREVERIPINPDGFAPGSATEFADKVIIPGNNITMKDMQEPILANGEVLMPGEEAQFDAPYVVEEKLTTAQDGLTIDNTRTSMPIDPKFLEEAVQEAVAKEKFDKLPKEVQERIVLQQQINDPEFRSKNQGELYKGLTTKEKISNFMSDLGTEFAYGPRTLFTLEFPTIEDRLRNRSVRKDDLGEVWNNRLNSIIEGTTWFMGGELFGAGLGKAGELSIPYILGAEEAAKKAIGNTYKLNPWAFKPDPTKFYHRSQNYHDNILGDRLVPWVQGNPELAARLTRTEPGKINIFKTKSRPDELYWSKGIPLDGRYIEQNYPGPYLWEMPSSMKSINKVNGKVRPFDDSVGAYKVNTEKLNVSDAKLYKEDWLWGYKPVDISKISGSAMRTNPPKNIDELLALPEEEILNLTGKQKWVWENFKNSSLPKERIEKELARALNKEESLVGQLTVPQNKVPKETRDLVKEGRKDAINWIKSDEWLKRRMKATGESREQAEAMQKTMLEDLKNTSVDFKNIQGKKVSEEGFQYVDQEGNQRIALGFGDDIINKNLRGNAEHEFIHAGTTNPRAFQGIKMDDIYPEISSHLDPNTKRFLEYLNQNQEKQVRGVRTLQYLKRSGKWDGSSEITDDMINHLKDNYFEWSSNGMGNDVANLISNVKDKKTLKDFLNSVYTASGIIAGGAAGSAGIKD